MTQLLVGFDSAWTAHNKGALTAVLAKPEGGYVELCLPQEASFPEAERHIRTWQAERNPSATLVMLDQPTVVKNDAGQRPVENLVGSPVSRRYGGVQPANRGKVEMFGPDAPVWPFLRAFGGPADVLARWSGTWVVETYPVLALIAQGWTLPCARATGRLPKYNPQRGKTFSVSDWRHLCGLTEQALRKHGFPMHADWVAKAAQSTSPRKGDQDKLDACLCLLTAVHLAAGRELLMVGELDSGTMVVPFGRPLHEELQTRCEVTGRPPSHWVRRLIVTS